MRFSVFAAALTGVSAMTIPSARVAKDQVGTNEAALATRAIDQVDTDEAALEKRAIVEAIITAASTAAADHLSVLAAQATVAAIDQAVALVKDLSNWTSAREAFTKKTTTEMWANNPSPGTYVAAICYNMDYSFANDNHTRPTKVELKSGLLHTNYDCIYMQKGNTFNRNGDGGFINYSFNDDGSCKYTPESLAC